MHGMTIIWHSKSTNIASPIQKFDYLEFITQNTLYPEYCIIFV